LEVVPDRARRQDERNRIAGDGIYRPGREIGVRDFNAMIRRKR
jgi:hypothetical protein